MALLFVSTFSQTSPGFYVSATQVYCKHCGKIERIKQFLLFPQCVLPFKKTLPFSPNLKLWSVNSFRLEESKICRLGKG